jgi:hypothetical protein
MKSLILAIGFFLIIGIGKVWAGGEMICYYPKICKEIKGTIIVSHHFNAIAVVLKGT